MGASVECSLGRGRWPEFAISQSVAEFLAIFTKENGSVMDSARANRLVVDRYRLPLCHQGSRFLFEGASNVPIVVDITLSDGAAEASNAKRTLQGDGGLQGALE